MYLTLSALSINISHGTVCSLCNNFHCNNSCLLKNHGCLPPVSSKDIVKEFLGALCLALSHEVIQSDLYFFNLIYFSSTLLKCKLESQILVWCRLWPLGLKVKTGICRHGWNAGICKKGGRTIELYIVPEAKMQDTPTPTSSFNHVINSHPLRQFPNH